jgi:putative tricarboxylic transport membrane protein
MGRDGWIGVGLLAFSGWLYANLHKIPANPLVPIGPALYPRIILLLTILLSLILVIQGLVAPQTDQTEKNKESTSSESWLKKYRPTLLAFLVFGLYVLLLPKLGYLLSTVMFVTALQWLLGAPSLRRLPGSLVVGVGTSLATYVVFEKYLHVFLPKGTWLP